MESAIRAKVERQLLTLLDEDDLDVDTIHLLAGDRTPTAAERAWLDQLHAHRGDRLFSDALFHLTQERFAVDDAAKLWNEIRDHKHQLSTLLGRHVGVVVAALDYLTNVRGLIAQPMLIRSRKMARVAEIALQDGLTGLFDHSTFVNKVEYELRRARRHQDSVCVVLGDIDDFKSINDRFGHLCGDQVLRRVGGVIAGCLRETDAAGRYGGEEFGILMPRTDIDSGRRAAERVRERIERAFHRDFEITLSLGVAVCPDHGDATATLLRAADEALYAAKGAGKNRVVIAGSD